MPRLGLEVYCTNMSNINEKRIEASAPEPSRTGCRAESDSDRPNLRVTVVATSDRGTLAALRTAGKLAANLGACVALLKTQVVPFPLPLERPPVSTNFRGRQLYGLMREAGIEAEEVTIQLCLCRDRNETLRRILRPNSLVVIGGPERWWRRSERALERYLNRLGHQVVFVDPDASSSESPARA